MTGPARGALRSAPPPDFLGIKPNRMCPIQPSQRFGEVGSDIKCEFLRRKFVTSAAMHLLSPHCGRILVDLGRVLWLLIGIGEALAPGNPAGRGVGLLNGVAGPDTFAV